MKDKKQDKNINDVFDFTVGRIQDNIRTNGDINLSQRFLEKTFSPITESFPSIIAIKQLL